MSDDNDTTEDAEEVDDFDLEVQDGVLGSSSEFPEEE